jgi:hypothetical protein
VRVLVVSVLALVLCPVAPAAAHIALRYPESRYGDFVLKEGPCGQAGGTRSEHVTELEPGAQIEVVWDEYTNHPGNFRISFDADGDDDFVDPACLSGCSTTMPEIERYSNASVLLDAIPDTPAGGLSHVMVTLPDIECDNCTLQVIQVMYDKPPYVTPGNDIYYQCADLVLRRGAVPCAGDCDGGGSVSIDELVVGIGISLGMGTLDDCRAIDADGDGRVRINDMVRAVDAALRTCAASAQPAH